MSSIMGNLTKVKKALTLKGEMPFINHEQFRGKKGTVTKYIVHYGKPKGKDNNTIAEVYSRVDLLLVLVRLLKAGDSGG